VRDAEEDFLVFITTADLAAAIPGDPCNCGGAIAARRSTGQTVAVCFKSVSYIGVPDSDKGHINRYVNGGLFRRLQHDLDTGGIPNPGGYVFKAPSPSWTLGGKNVPREGPRPAQTPRESIIKGTADGERVIIRNAGTDRPSGVGMVHFVSEKLKNGKNPFA